MAPVPELSVFVSMAPAPELRFFLTWLQLCPASGIALLIQFNNFDIPTVLLVASERVIPIYFELIWNSTPTTRPAQAKSEGVWSWVAGVGKNSFKKIWPRADLLLADCGQCCHSVIKKTPEFTLKKTGMIKNLRHTKCLKQSKSNLKCTLLELAHKKLQYYALFASRF